MIITIWFYGMLFFVGVSIGSFINAFEYRLHRGLDFLKQRSICPQCKHVLGVMDLIPLLSFCLIGGRCRYCGTKVSWQYPIIEFLSGLVFLASGCYVWNRMHIQGLSEILLLLLISSFLGCILSLFLFFGLYDVKHKIVPNKVVFPAIMFVMILNLTLALGMHWRVFPSLLEVFEGFNILWNTLSGLLGGLFIASLILITRGKGMGGGDLKLVVLMGLFLGWKKFIVAMYIAIISGAIIGLLWGLHKGRIKGLQIPFALFLSFGTISAFLLGDEIFRLYFGVFL